MLLLNYYNISLRSMRSNFTIYCRPDTSSNWHLFANENRCKNVVRLNFSDPIQTHSIFQTIVCVFDLLNSYSIILFIIVIIITLLQFGIGPYYHTPYSICCVPLYSRQYVCRSACRRCRLGQSMFIFIRFSPFFHYFSVIYVSAHISSVGSQQKRIFTKTKTTKSMKGQQSPDKSVLCLCLSTNEWK